MAQPPPERQQVTGGSACGMMSICADRRPVAATCAKSADGTAM
nr:hypothetical protein [Roseovarius pacificus]